MSQQQPRRKTQPSKTQAVAPFVSIPDKLYFRIGDVAQLCDLQAYVLRYWETEFPQLKPNKGGTGQRLYRKRDVELVLEIKRLLYTEGFTIAGARRLLAEKRTSEKSEEPVRDNSGRMDMARGQTAALLDSQKSAGMDSKAPSLVDTRTPKEPPAKHQISDLRREMRELLNLLEADTPEYSIPILRSKREIKKSNPSDEEPTLFS